LVEGFNQLTVAAAWPAVAWTDRGAAGRETLVVALAGIVMTIVSVKRTEPIAIEYFRKFLFIMVFHFDCLPPPVYSSRATLISPWPSMRQLDE
jgi:hypothetical protein